MDKGPEAYISNKNHFSDGVKFQGGRQHWTMNKKTEFYSGLHCQGVIWSQANHLSSLCLYWVICKIRKQPIIFLERSNEKGHL